MIELTERNPQVFLPMPQQNNAFIVQTYWTGGSDPHDLDQVLILRGRNDMLGIIQPAGYYGSLDEFPFMRLDGDDQTGGRGEIVYGNTYAVAKRVAWMGVGVYDNSARQSQLGRIRGLGVAFQVPGCDPVVVRFDGVETDICAALQIFPGEQGFQVVLDMVGLSISRNFPTPQAVFRGHWGKHLMWGAK